MQSKHVGLTSSTLPHATAQIPTDKIGLVIGPGGRTITGIKADSGCEEIQVRLGSVFLTSPCQPRWLGHVSGPV